MGLTSCFGLSQGAGRMRRMRLGALFLTFPTAALTGNPKEALPEAAF